MSKSKAIADVIRAHVDACCDAASKAMIEGDVVAMLRICQKLQDWSL